MEEHEPGPATTTGVEPNEEWHPPGATPKDPGWYPTGANPNERAYWDGQAWTATRHWTVTGWVEEGVAPTPDRETAPPRYSANPYVPPTHSRRRAAPATFNLGVLLLMVSGVALMYGSVGTWVKVSGSGFADFHISINGTDPSISTLIGVNGWVTFIGGIVLLVFAGLALASEDRFIGLLTTVVAFVTLVFAIYDMFRIVQKITQTTAPIGSSVSIGWGLICVLSGAVLAMLVALVRMLQR